MHSTLSLMNVNANAFVFQMDISNPAQELDMNLIQHFENKPTFILGKDNSGAYFLQFKSYSLLG